jgi:translation elongation factor EF-G
VERTYTGPQTGELVEHMRACNPRGPLIIHVAKLFPRSDVSAFDALGRILSGTVKPGDRVRVLGEAYTPEDEEDSAVAEVSSVWVYQARYRIPLTKALAGMCPLPGVCRLVCANDACTVSSRFLYPCLNVLQCPLETFDSVLPFIFAGGETALLLHNTHMTWTL